MCQIGAKPFLHLVQTTPLIPARPALLAAHLTLLPDHAGRST